MKKTDRIPGIVGTALVLAGMLVVASTAFAGNCRSGTSSARQVSTDASHAGMEPAKSASHGHSADIVAVAVGAGSFQTLVKAVQAAGLVETLQGEGPFTVFAPTDEAFAKLPAGTVEALLKDKKRLTEVLTYHVVPGKVMAADVMKLTSAKTVQGTSVKIDTKDGVKIDGANVVKADVPASNGVIHVIDRVILPAETKAEL